MHNLQWCNKLRRLQRVGKRVGNFPGTAWKPSMGSWASGVILRSCGILINPTGFGDPVSCPVGPPFKGYISHKHTHKVLCPMKSAEHINTPQRRNYFHFSWPHYLFSRATLRSKLSAFLKFSYSALDWETVSWLVIWWIVCPIGLRRVSISLVPPLFLSSPLIRFLSSSNLNIIPHLS